MHDIKLYQVDPFSADLREEIEVPPMRGAFTLPAVRVRGRLARTRTGLNADWSATSKDVMTSRSSRTPFVDLIFRDATVLSLGYHAPAKKFVRIDPVLGELYYNPDLLWGLSAGGTAVDAPFCIFSHLVPYDVTRRAERELLFACLAEIPSDRTLDVWEDGQDLRELWKEQGHLTARRVTWSLVSLSDVSDINYDPTLERHPNRPVTLFNHAVFVSSVIGLDNMRLIKVEQDSVVSSPDHPLERLVLQAGWWLLSHPWPAEDID